MTPQQVMKRYQNWRTAGAVAESCDAALLAAFRHHRSEAAFREVVRRHGKMVLAAARRVLGEVGDADDVFQATFLLLAQRPQAVKRGDALGSWLYGVAYRLALRQQRGERRRAKHEGRACRPAIDAATRAAAAQELQAEIGAAVGALPPRYRQPLIYCCLEERTPDEAARLLGCPVGTLWSRLSRAREKLRKELHRRGWPLEALALSALLHGTTDAARLPELSAAMMKTLQFTPTLQVLPAARKGVAHLMRTEKSAMTMKTLTMWAATFCLLGAGIGSLLIGAATAVEPPQPAAKLEPPVPAATAPTPKSGTLRGIITAADTGEPVAGAAVRVLLQGTGRRGVAVATSGSDGRYELQIPVGHGALWGVDTPSGFYIADPNTRAVFVTTSELPEHVANFKLERGSPWHVELADPSVAAGKQLRFSANSDVKPGTLIPTNRLVSLAVVGGADGRAVLSLPKSLTTCRLGAHVMAEGDGFDLGPATLEQDEGFDSTAIVGAPVKGAKGTQLTDRAGRHAVVSGAEVTLVGQQPKITFAAAPEAASTQVNLRGRLVDEAGKPVAGGQVTLCCYAKGSGSIAESGAVTTHKALSDDEGHFAFSPRLPAASWDTVSSINVIATKAGRRGMESKKLSKAEIVGGGVADFGALTLEPGKTLVGKVVDEDGQPLAGAVVMNSTGYFLNGHLACRTAADGTFAMADQAYGNQKLSATYGERGGNADYDFSPTSEGCVIVAKPMVRDGVRSPARPASTLAAAAMPKSDPSTWDLTPPLKEPKYAAAPHYALVVTGPNKEGRHWLVLEGNLLHADLNGNGDLTDLGECLRPEAAKNGTNTFANPGFHKNFEVYKFILSRPGAPATVLHLHHWIRDPEFVPASGNDNDKAQYAEWQKNRWETATLWRVVAGKQAQNPMLFVPCPIDAQVSHLDGPLTFGLKFQDRQCLQTGPGGSDFSVHIGTPGKPARNSRFQVFSPLVLEEIPPTAYPRVNATAGSPATTWQEALKERCCGDTLHGPIRVPKGVKAKEASITISLEGPWERTVEPRTFTVAIED